MGQVEAVRIFLQLPKSFDAIIQRLWLAFVTTTELDYSEEQLVESTQFENGEEDSTINFSQDLPQDRLEFAPQIFFPTSPGEFQANFDGCEFEGEAEEAAELRLPFESEATGEDDKDTELATSLIFDDDITFPPMPKSYKIKMVTPRMLLILLYFGLQEVGVPILLGDIRRMVLDGIVPYENVGYLIPTLTRRALERRRQMLVFYGKKWVPSAYHLMGVASRIAHQLAAHAHILIRPLNLGALTHRLIIEFSLPCT